MSHRKTVRAKITLAIVVFVLSDVLLAQLGKAFLWHDPTPQQLYRTASPSYHHDLVPMTDASVTWGGSHYRLKTNSLGFRDHEIQRVPLRSSSYRILVIGDSFTEGVGLDYEDTFVGLLAHSMRSRHGIEVLNAGVVSYSPSIYYKKVEHLIEEVGLEFDEIVVFLDISDIQDEALFYDIDLTGNVALDGSAAQEWGVYLETNDEDPSELSRIRVKAFLKRNSIVLRSVHALKQRLGQIGSQEPVVEGSDGSAPRLSFSRSLWTVDDEYFEAYGRVGLAKADLRLTRLLGLLARHDIPMTLVVYPWPDQVARGDRDSIQVRFWRDWAAERDVRFIDLFPIFFSQPADQVLARYFIPGDVHFNAGGHRRVADELVEELSPPAESAAETL